MLRGKAENALRERWSQSSILKGTTENIVQNSAPHASLDGSLSGNSPG